MRAPQEENGSTLGKLTCVLLASGQRLHFAIENGPRNSGSSHKNMVIIHSYGSLPEGIVLVLSDFIFGSPRISTNHDLDLSMPRSEDSMPGLNRKLQLDPCSDMNISEL